MTDHRYSRHTQALSFYALENAASDIDTFLSKLALSLKGADGAVFVDGLPGELAYLRETIIEHLRGQFLDVFEAAAEWSDENPMAVDQ